MCVWFEELCCNLPCNQHTATRLQQTATHCIVLLPLPISQGMLVCPHCNTCNTLHHAATHYNTHYNRLLHTATHCIVRLPLPASRCMLVSPQCNILQHTASRCNALQSCQAIAHPSDRTYRVYTYKSAEYRLFYRSLLQKSPTKQRFFENIVIQIEHIVYTHTKVYMCMIWEVALQLRCNLQCNRTPFW